MSKKVTIILMTLLTSSILGGAYTAIAHEIDEKQIVLDNRFTPTETKAEEVSIFEATVGDIGVVQGDAEGALIETQQNQAGKLYEVDLDVYSDHECTIPVRNIDWGEGEVGGEKSVVIYIENNGVVDTVASLVSENWYPENAAEYMTLSWDYDGKVVSPGEVLDVVLTLEISAECPLLDDFRFDIVVIGS